MLCTAKKNETRKEINKNYLVCLKCILQSFISLSTNRQTLRKAKAMAKEEEKLN